MSELSHKELSKIVKFIPINDKGQNLLVANAKILSMHDLEKVAKMALEKDANLLGIIAVATNPKDAIMCISIDDLKESK